MPRDLRPPRRPTGALTLALALLGAVGCGRPAPDIGEKRWAKFRALRPEVERPDKPRIRMLEKTLKPDGRFALEVLTIDRSYLYVLLMLPNNDIYLLAPSAKVQDHRGPRILLPPEGATWEFFIPKGLTGPVSIGAIASEQNLSLLSEGWQPPDRRRDFATWPAELPFDPACEFIEEVLSDRPWSLSTVTLESAR